MGGKARLQGTADKETITLLEEQVASGQVLETSSAMRHPALGNNGSDHPTDYFRSIGLPDFVMPSQWCYLDLETGLKLIVGNPGIGVKSGVPPETLPPENKFPTGWVTQLGGYEQPPANPDRVWLFNITSDIEERVDLHLTMPDAVKSMIAYMDGLPKVEQGASGFDPASCPPKRGSRFWAPWRPDPEA